MHRFFIPPAWLDQDRVVIKGKQVHQLRDVLRLSAGERIVVLDNSGWEYEVELEAMTRGQVEGVIRERRRALAEPLTRITVYQALLKGSKFEFVLQKGTELGVVGFVPMVCERCVGHLSDVTERKMDRWQRIVVEAAEQSMRGRLPFLSLVVLFQQACQSATGLSLLAWEEERILGLRDALKDRGDEDLPSLNIFIGPEGGFAPSEVEFARGCGIIPVSLGSRVLRAETAALVAATSVLYERGELGLPY